MDRSSAAVSVRNANKSYTLGNKVLDNLNLTVASGTIYSLIGGSGCGKTTILSCVVGLQRLDSGDISVFGKEVGSRDDSVPKIRIGYMPQEYALYEFLTIEETLIHFGRLYAMNYQQITSRSTFFIKLLRLPGKNRKIRSLSGGQHRLASLAVSLLHDPDILILDEPTVGLDPLLRESIWNHLRNLVTERRTTIILSTHYIEETRHSNKIGFMRHGRLLVEEDPVKLLSVHSVIFLSDVLLELCKADSQSRSQNNQTFKSNMQLNNGNENTVSTEVASNTLNGIAAIKFTRTTESVKPMVEGSWSHLKRNTSKTLHQIWFRILALTIKNYWNLFRNMIYILGLIILPAIHITLTSLTIGHELQEMRLGVVNKEYKDWQQTCPNETNMCGSDLSCGFLSCLMKGKRNFFKLIPAQTDQVALEMVKSGKVWGYISIPKSYTDSMANRALMMQDADNFTLENSVISLKLDMSQYLAGVFIVTHAYAAYLDFLKENVEICGGDSRIVELPFNLSHPIFGATDTNFVEYIIPGVLVLSIHMMILASAGVTVITDKKQKTLDRCRVAGVNTVEIMISYFITDASVMIFQTVLSSAILIIGFKLNIQGSIISFLVVCIITGLCGQSSGVLVGALCRDEIEALVWGIFIYFPMLLLSGVCWPLQAMPYWLRCFAYCLPLTLPCDTLRSITSRGTGIMHPLVWPGIVIPIGWMLLFWFLAWLVLESVQKNRP